MCVGGGGLHSVKVRVLDCLDIFKLKRPGIFATCSGLFCKKKRLAKGGSRVPQGPSSGYALEISTSLAEIQEEYNFSPSPDPIFMNNEKRLLTLQ